MKMIYPAFGLLLILCLGFLLYVRQTEALLPLRLASHFDAAGQPNGWMNRSSYTSFIAIFGLGLPAFTVAMGFLTRLMPAWAINVPNRDYWLAPERRKDLNEFVLLHCVWLACLEVGLVGALHYLTIVANNSKPVRMPGSGIMLVLGLFLTAIGLWAFALVWHFRSRS
jgi:serine/threonine-protein kinase